MYNVVALASCGGGIFKALVEKSQQYNYKVMKLLTNKECAALDLAAELHIPSDAILLKGDELFRQIDTNIPESTDLIVLAGFLPILPPWFCQKWRHKIINVHPSLLPAYGGKGMYGVHVQEAVMANHETYAGCTIHYVTAGIDEGEIIEQWKLRIDYSLTPWELGGEVFNRSVEMLPVVIGNLAKKKESVK